MEEQQDFKLRFHRLLGFMSDVGYARGSIAYVNEAIEEMASQSVTPTSSDYEEAICRAVGHNIANTEVCISRGKPIALVSIDG